MSATVAAVHSDLRSLIGGRVVLDPHTPPAERLAAISLAPATLANEKRSLAAVIGEDRIKSNEDKKAEHRRLAEIKKAERLRSTEAKLTAKAAARCVTSSSSGSRPDKRRSPSRWSSSRKEEEDATTSSSDGAQCAC